MNPQQDVNQPLGELPKEQIIFQIKRHPIGIISVYVTSSVLLIVLAVVAFGLAPRYLTSSSTSQIYGIASVIYFIFLLLVVGFVYISHMVYWDNSWTLSNESLTQVTRSSLFDKQSSHLSLGNLQDVTASQEGVLPHLFHYGSIRVETAGEGSKFVFPLCPNPNVHAQYILEARERFEQSSRVVNDGLQTAYMNQPQAYQQPAPQPVPMQAPMPPTEEAQTYPIPPQPPMPPDNYSA